MILKLVVDVLTVEFRVDMCQDNFMDNVFTEQWIVGGCGLAFFNGK